MRSWRRLAIRRQLDRPLFYYTRGKQGHEIRWAQSNFEGIVKLPMEDKEEWLRGASLVGVWSSFRVGLEMHTIHRTAIGSGEPYRGRDASAS